jgi:hypothetical protein
MNLAVNTPKGQRISAIENKLLDFLRTQYPDATFAHTPARGAAFIDLVVVQRGEVTTIAEIKVRSNSIAQVRGWGGYLLSYHKIEQLAQGSRILGVPSFLFVFFTPDEELLSCPIADAQGNIVVGFSRQVRVTQDTVLGGKKVDEVAIIPMDYFGDL